MGAEIFSRIKTLALFQKRVEGDDALLELARLRFREAGLGAEFYAETRSELEHLLRFRPGENPVALHLPRGMNLFDDQVRTEITSLARDFREVLFGVIVHDQGEVPERFENCLSALAGLDHELSRSQGGPMLFVEYAAGLDPEVFTEIFRRCRDLGNVSACIDICHLAMSQARRLYGQRGPHRDIFSFTPDDPQLPACIAEIQDSLSNALEEVLAVVRDLSCLGKPLHYHLHDGHPLSTASPFGVPDHLSFLGVLRLPFEHEGSRDLPLTFGPRGLAMVLAESLRNPSSVSYSLEIHPTGQRMPLDDGPGLFRHWADTANAEKMNHWLAVLAENHRLLCDTLRTLADPKETTGQG
jgi:hypothetical protein